MTTNTDKKEATEARLKRLGFTKAAESIMQTKRLARKLAVAYEHFRFVRIEKIQEFNAKLYLKTKNDRDGYKKLSFTPLGHYEATPPADVLDALETAITRDCFSSFEVAHITRVPDPILFGVVDGCTDRFFIAQWDNDVKIEDILKENEG